MPSPDVTAVDAAFDRSFGTGSAPGIAYGVVVDGDLIHHRGMGTLRDGETAPPDADSVFRIASMSKSFTAATLVSLRDEGRLRFDDPVARWVPELVDWPRATADSPPITVEHLLTMSAGLPTDDPWGDRQQGLPLEDFATFLRSGPGLAWAPGTTFEYSNTGYGILGRVITAVTGLEFSAVVRERILGPMGMMTTAYRAEDVEPDRLAQGYVRRDDAWLVEPIDGLGALAPMGGIFTSIRDLSRWVTGFLDAFPPRDDPDGAHPLSRTSRREMQQPRRPFVPEVTQASIDVPPALTVFGYGYGLMTADDLVVGRVIGHGGGYPGFGSQMRWHPATGIGVLAFGNSRYAPMHIPTRDSLAALVTAAVPFRHRVRPWPETLAARATVEGLLDRWDDATAADLFAMNVDLDEPMPRRRAAAERLREVHGRLTRDTTEPDESDSAADLRWWLAGERGRVLVEILLSPERPPRVQTLKVTSVPEPAPELARLADRLVAAIGDAAAVLPADVAVAPTFDREAAERAMRVAGPRLGPATLGRAIGGDGARVARWRLVGARETVELELGLDPDGALVSLTIAPPTRRPPTGG